MEEEDEEEEKCVSVEKGGEGAWLVAVWLKTHNMIMPSNRASSYFPSSATQRQACLLSHLLPVAGTHTHTITTRAIVMPS